MTRYVFEMLSGQRLKMGRVLNAENESHLRKAADALDEGLASIESLVAQLEASPGYSGPALPSRPTASRRPTRSASAPRQRIKVSIVPKAPKERESDEDFKQRMAASFGFDLDAEKRIAARARTLDVADEPSELLLDNMLRPPREDAPVESGPVEEFTVKNGLVE